ncbi:MAG: DUF2085 domain-containing protein [Candidatus Bathyarchaeota archaeon]|nr:MAG: DUF2085 domain-containing protein [Candidatus Bathyarchaeota archaeon]
MVHFEGIIIDFFDLVGSLVCHQIPERTLWIGGRYLPVCSRDAGAYLGLYIGYFLLPLRRKEACGPPNLWATLLMVIPMIVDATTQVLGLRTSTNELRLMTGLLFGVALAPMLCYLVSLAPTSKKLPVIRNLFPKSVRLDDKEYWLSSKSLGIGLLGAVALFFVVNPIVGSNSQIFYWLMSPPIVFSAILHIFLLPIFLVFSFLINLKLMFNTHISDTS